MKRSFLVGTIMIVAVLIGCGKDAVGPGGTGPCVDDRPFSVSALPFDEINHISPLGNLNPPGHTLPTAHTYWNVHAPGAKQVPVRAPGDIVIWRLDRVQYSNRPSDDYTLDFEVCRSVRGRFAHVSTLSPALAAVVAGPGQCQTYTTLDGTTTNCSYTMKQRVGVGEVVGYVGDVPYGGGLDFGLEDDRVPTAWANPQRRGPSSHVCPVDYYVPALREQLSTRFGDGLTFRNAAPRCGRFNFDVPGTASGSWFKVGATGFLENSALALAADNVYPTSLAFSIGLIGSTYDGFVLHFNASDGGRVRRAFEAVSSDGIYCYDQLHSRRDMIGSPLSNVIILLELRGDGRLQFETRAGTDCGSGPWTFTTSAVTLER